MDNDLKGLGIAIPSILLPDEKTNMKKWAVVACDQFTSDAKFWSDVEKTVGNAPSTLHMILPEIYLKDDDVEMCIRDRSKGEGRKLIQGGGVSLNGEKVTDVFMPVTQDNLEDGSLIIKKGKKVFHRVVVK